jgi:hypothetical protein
MDIWCFIAIGYFLVGIILAFIWWYNEYELEYELEREEEGVEEPMAVLLLVGLVLFWPFNAVKKYFESFVD